MNLLRYRQDTYKYPKVLARYTYSRRCSRSILHHKICDAHLHRQYTDSTCSRCLSQRSSSRNHRKHWLVLLELELLELQLLHLEVLEL